MHTSYTSSPRRIDRALVLGGGGSTGNAWLIGVIAGLASTGLDVASANLTIGTSAGATAAAQLTGDSAAALYEATLATPPMRPGPVSSQSNGSRPATSRPATSRSEAARPVTSHLEALTRTVAASADLADFRRRIGTRALEREADSDGSWSSGWRDTVAARLPRAHWRRDRDILLTALDARTGVPREFSRGEEVNLIDAVAASCASGLPYRIGEHAYLDGGFRTNAENADLAAGAERVLVLSPFGGRSLHPERWGTHLAAQVHALRTGGSLVEVIVPDAETEHLFGPHAMNPSLRPDAARAGFATGLAQAPRVRALWSE
ncbi:patatin-like phospholipase family protein [Mycetocola lacteus]|uniref:Patatin-like phospholipase family protein n=1 Tax=Mycetocola lacteus TaxID=76637 RepID=A0A3L7ANU3_9MICO|nr:patatin-like phospholipase family protein [Mycetocola lacteus]RLP82173.1 patatin-like phospholipase family protein [Mycetocola lacteus]